jgi:hypothetical protein
LRSMISWAIRVVARRTSSDDSTSFAFMSVPSAV